MYKARVSKNHEDEEISTSTCANRLGTKLKITKRYV